MIFSKRERYITGAAIAVVCLLAFDRFVLGPLLENRQLAAGRKAALTTEVSRDSNVLSRHRQLGPRWRLMTSTSLKADPGEAESQVLHAVRDCADEAGLDLSLLKPDRMADKTRLPQVAFQAAGTGNMSAVSRFIWLLETSKIPVRITELQLGTRKEGADDLSLQVRLTTVHLPASQPAAEAPVAVAAPASEASNES